MIRTTKVNSLIYCPTVGKINLPEPWQWEQANAYDLSQRWYVIFYAWNVSDNKLKRKRYFGNINSFDTKSERTKEANKLIKIINEALIKDYVLGNEQGETKEDTPILTDSPKLLSISEAINQALSIKLQSDRDRTKETYRSFGNIFCGFIEEYRLEKISITEFSPKYIYKFLDYLKQKREVGNTTRNNYLRYTRALFNTLKVREIILKNPCDDIGDLPEEIGKNIAFQEDQQTLLEHWMKSNDLSLYILTKFIYYSFIRPKELVHLQIAHIDLINRQIIVPAKTSKNKKQDFVTINKSLAAIIEKLNLEQYPRSYYLFSKELKPGKEKIHRNRLTDRHREALKSTKLYNNELTLYSWKHTGVVNAYRAGVDIKTLQIQLRHHSLEMTDIYLKSLGLKVSKELIDKEW